MLAKLQNILKNELPALLEKPEVWDSLLINRRKPYTYRVFTYLPDKTRIALHKFETCDMHEAFAHPHPWPGAFMILAGQYEMKLGLSPDRQSDPQECSTTLLSRYSGYEILNPLTWHAVVPKMTTYTVMINGEPWSADFAHEKAPTTKGKDLDKIPSDELLIHLNKFKFLIHEYNHNEEDMKADVEFTEMIGSGGFTLEKAMQLESALDEFVKE